jgi:type IV secretory pathway TrbF-like protein
MRHMSRVTYVVNSDTSGRARAATAPARDVTGDTILWRPEVASLGYLFARLRVEPA